MAKLMHVGKTRVKTFSLSLSLSVSLCLSLSLCHTHTHIHTPHVHTNDQIVLTSFVTLGHLLLGINSHRIQLLDNVLFSIDTYTCVCGERERERERQRDKEERRTIGKGQTLVKGKNTPQNKIVGHPVHLDAFGENCSSIAQDFFFPKRDPTRNMSTVDTHMQCTPFLSRTSVLGSECSLATERWLPVGRLPFGE